MIKFNHDFSSRFRILKGGKVSLVVSALLGSAIIASAAPTGGAVTSGNATISQSGNITNIDQSTQKASINWQGFSISSNETVNFNQPNVDSITLNRVVGNERSVIDGALNANGQVWILNSNGILFNKNAKVNTAGLIATTKNISDSDFQAGNYKFSGNSTASVVNLGTIEASDNGYVALLANTVQNDGTIKAYKGTVHLTGASEATINLNGNSIVSLTVNKGVLDALVENKGAIIADGGKIYLTVSAVDEILKGVVNNSGIIEANSMDDVLGEVELLAKNGYVENSGKIDVSSQNGKGGKATVTGYHTMITDTGVINADGKTGGGTVQVGGSWQNSDKSVYQATGTIVAKGAKLTANATDNGDGGTVVAWSDIYNPNSVTRAGGIFEARGGENGGDGGRVETSGHYLDITGAKVGTLAPKGETGIWLLDPDDMVMKDGWVGSYDSSTSSGLLTVWDVGGNNASSTYNLDAIEYTLNDTGTYGGNVIVKANNDIYLDQYLYWNTDRSLTLEAGNNIIFNASLVGDNYYSTLNLKYGSSVAAGTIKHGNSAGHTIKAGTINIEQGYASRNAGTILAPNLKFEPLSEFRSVNYNLVFSPLDIFKGKINTNNNMKVLVKYNTILQDAWVTNSDSNGGGLQTQYVAGHDNPSIGGVGGNASINVDDWSLYITRNLGTTYTGAITGDNYIYLTDQASQEFGAITTSGWSGYLYINTGGSLYLGTDLTKNIYVNGGTLRTNGNTTRTLSYLSMSSGSVQATGGLLVLNSFNLSGGSVDASNGVILKGSSDQTINSTFSSGTVTLTPTSGNPIYTFNGNSTGSFTAVVNSGAIAHMGHANALGASGAITVNSGGTLRVGSGITTSATKTLTLNGAGVSGQNGALTVGSGTGTFGGTITLGSDTTIGTVNSSSNLTLANSVNGAKNLTVNSAGTVTFNNSVGGTTALTSITSNSGGTTLINANVTTTGAQTYNDTVSITGARTLISNNGQFNFTGGATANNNLILQSPASTSMALTGNINVGSYWLNLKNASGTSGTLSSTGTLSGIGLLVQNFATANLNLASGHNFTTIAANGIGTAYNYIDQDGVTIGTVNGVNGLALGSATGNVATKTGNLTISNNIATTNATVSALILNAGSDAGSGTSTGGDIIRTAGTISVGAAGTAKLYTGSIAESTGWAGTTLISGSGRFRYGSDEVTTGYSKALSTGLNLIYREQPTIGATVSSSSKTYDGASYSGTPTLSYTMKNGDTAGADITIGTSVLTGDTTAKNAGSYSIGANLSGFSNTLGYANPTTATAGTLTINQKALSLSGTQVYDSTTNITSSALTLNNLVNGEDLIIIGTGTVANKNVGTAKTVTLGSLALNNGTSGLAANYTFTGGTYTVNITKADISSISGITASNKVYDRTTTATLDKTTAVTINGRLGSDVLSVATATGNFSDKNVADGKTVNITGLTLSGTDEGNYNLVDTTASTTANITAKNLILSGTTASNKVYDKTTTATISAYGTLGGIIGADTVTLDSTSASASFADWNVANGKTVTVGGLVLSGGDAGNYTFSQSGTVTANITPKSLGLELTGTATRVYDATTSLNFTGYTVAPTGVISGDTVVADTGSITGFIDKNVGTGKQVTFTGFTLSGADMANYQLVSGSAVSNASITAATISSVSGITASNKVYDATTGATLATGGASFNGKFGADVLSVASATGTFSDKNVGTAKTVNISGITLTGTDAGNYLLANTTATANADITQKALAITYAGVNKTYDGGASATVTTSDNRLGSDLFTIARTAAFVDKTAANGKMVNVTGVSLSGTDALNYSVTTTGTTTANITKKDVTVTGLAVDNKVYDGGTTATFSNTGTLVDYISGDDVAVNTGGMSAAFGDKNVGTAKSVTLSGVTLTGTDAGNYNFTSPTGATADITAKTLAVTYAGVNKVYDSTTAATVTTSDNRVGADVLTIARTATFSNKNVADGKTVTVSGVALSGTDALNYTVATTGTTTANITKADISAVTGITAQNKVYDTTNTATLVTSTAAFTGMFANDVLEVSNAAGAFSNKNAANGKTVSISGITLGGTDAGNYNLITDTASTTANISKATISAISGISADNKVYDTTTTATLTTGSAIFTGLLTGDNLLVTTSTASFGDKNVGNGKTVTIDSITFGGTDAGNYEIANNLSTLTADITPASISAITGIIAANKVYDRTTDATLNVSGAAFTGKIGSDVLSVATRTGTFATDWNVGTGKTVDITGLTLGGTDALNYTLADTTASTTANITKKVLVLDLQGAGSKVYDGTASINLTGVTPTLTGIITGDAVTVATGSVTGFVDKNVGANKAVLYSGFALSNTDAGNYDIGSGTAPSTASITRLDSVTWTGGGATNSWFDADNWGGKVPDLSNVANVVIPTGVTVSFDTAGATSGVSTSAVNIDSLGTLGSMNMTNGALNVASSLTLSSLTQSGGTIATGSLSITDSFSQSGTTGTIAVANNAVINQTTGDISLGNISTGGTLSATAQSGNINQVADSILATTGLSSFNATGNIALDSVNNNFTTIALSGTNVSFKDSIGGVILGNVATTGTFSATSSDGNITQTNSSLLSIAGETTLDAGADDVNLANSTNDFQSAVNVSGADTVTLSDANGLKLGNIASTGSLDVTAQDNITQKTGTGIATSGDVSLASVSGNITLDSTTNNFGGSLGLSGDDVSVSNYAHALTLGDVTSNGALSIATNNQAITQAIGSTLTSNGTASLNAGSADVTLTNSGNDFNELTLIGNNLAFKDSIGGVTLGNIATAGTFSATSTGGNIAQASGTSLALIGNASFNSGAYNTVLTNSGNDFTTLALAGNNLSFQDSVGTTTLGNVSTTGALSATNTVGGITQGVGTSMSIGTDAIFDVGTNNFALSNAGNSFGSLGVTANDVSISNISGDLTLANMSVAGTLGVNIENDILQKAGTTIEVVGETTLTTNSGDIALNGTNNDFSTINASGVNVALADVNGIELGDITSSGTLDVEAVGTISQTNDSIINATGETSLASTSGDVTLDGTNNNFSTINASGVNVALADVNGIELGDITSSGTLDVEAEDDITQKTGTSLVTGGDINLASTSGDITLDSPTNNFGGSFGASGENIALTNYSNPLILGNIVSNQSLAIETNDTPITQATGSKLTLNGTASMNAGTSNIDLSNPGNDYPSITLVAGSVTAAETIGEAAARIEVARLAAQEAARIEAERLASEKNTDIPNIVDNVTKNVSNIVNDIDKIVKNMDLKNLINTNLLTNQNINNINVNNFFINNVNLSLNNQSFILSIPKVDDEVTKVTYTELIKMYNDINPQNNEQSNEIRIPIFQNSMVELVNGGINLPTGIDQEFYIVRDFENKKGAN